MYNSFIHQQRANRFRELEESRLKEVKWHKRYQTEVQPELLEHYDKRINSFIHHVGETPIRMNPEQRQTHDEKLKTLVFRNAEDWRSFYNIRERLENKKHQEFISLKNIKETGKIIPTPYQTPQRDYRSRSKQLEIHPPMRYRTANRRQSSEISDKKSSLSEFIRIQRAKDKERSKFQIQSSKPNANNLITTHHSNATSKHYDEDDGDFLKHERTENIEIEARIYEKQRQIVEKKLHFKKLLDLSVKNPSESNRREYKTILERCGLMHGKKGSIKSQTTEMDKFTSLIESGEKQR